MTATATPQQSGSREAALDAITEAHRLVGGTNEKLAQIDPLQKQRKETRHPSDERPRPAVLVAGLSPVRLVGWSLVGLLALASIGVVVRQSIRGQVAAEPISTSSVSIKKREELPTPGKADVAAKTDAGPPQPSRAQTTLERVAADTAPAAVPMATDLSPQIQMIVRELANLQQGIEQLKTGQAQIARDNAELAGHLKAAEEIARHNAGLAEDLKAAQTQMARDNINLANQLKASQEQMAGIAEQLKESQEQVARLVDSKQKQRPRTLASSPLPIASPASKPVPTAPPPPVRARAQDPRRLQPKPQ
jgi:hypothetical protein